MKKLLGSLPGLLCDQVQSAPIRSILPFTAEAADTNGTGYACDVLTTFFASPSDRFVMHG